VTSLEEKDDALSLIHARNIPGERAIELIVNTMIVVAAFVLLGGITTAFILRVELVAVASGHIEPDARPPRMTFLVATGDAGWIRPGDAVDVVLDGAAAKSDARIHAIVLNVRLARKQTAAQPAPHAGVSDVEMQLASSADVAISRSVSPGTELHAHLLLGRQRVGRVFFRNFMQSGGRLGAIVP
jgi:hypothetical protein